MYIYIEREREREGGREGEEERQTDRQTDTHTHTHTQREGGRERELTWKQSLTTERFIDLAVDSASCLIAFLSSGHTDTSTYVYTCTHVYMYMYICSTYSLLTIIYTYVHV